MSAGRPSREWNQREELKRVPDSVAQWQGHEGHRCLSHHTSLVGLRAESVSPSVQGGGDVVASVGLPHRWKKGALGHSGELLSTSGVWVYFALMAIADPFHLLA